MANRTPTSRQSMRLWMLLVLLAASALLTGGCRFFRAPEATRTPVPTYTPTPLAVDAQGSEPAAEAAAPAQEPAGATTAPEAAPVEPAPAPTETPVPATPTATATLPPLPTDTPTAVPSPTPTATPAPTATPQYDFELETAEKFPTDSLAPNVVRIYAYVYSPSEFGLPGYSLRVDHNGVNLPVDQVSADGLPESTRQTPGPYTRFLNFDIILVEPQAGTWTLQLVDDEQTPAGPPVTFQLTADEVSRELYVRYKQK